MEFLQQGQGRMAGFNAGDGIYKRRLVGLAEGCRQELSGCFYKVKAIAIQFLQSALHTLFRGAPGA
jgi:hypothetical protein